jgi:hypothetical protein
MDIRCAHQRSSDTTLCHLGLIPISKNKGTSTRLFQKCSQCLRLLDTIEESFILIRKILARLISVNVQAEPWAG